jgi:anti-sigma factor RsiW
MSRPPISETDLQAYVDDRLDPSRRAEIDAYLAMHPAEAARLAEYRRQNEQLRALLNPALNEPIPPQLRRLPRTSAHGLRWRAAAVVTWIGLGGLLGTMLGWELRGAPPMVAQIPQMSEMPDAPRATVGERLAWRAAVAHAVYSPDTRRPVEIGADQEAQLVSWLSKRLGVKLKPPSLRAQGYELIGGRLLPGAKGPVAQFMYHDTKGQRLTLYVSSERQDKQNTAFHFAEEGPIGVFYWIDNGMGYAISAGTNRNELARVALAVYNQITPQ